MFDWSSVIPGLPPDFHTTPSNSISPSEKSEDATDNSDNNDNSILRRMDRTLGVYLTPGNIEVITESCPFIAIRNGVIGFGFGGLLGLFMSGMGTSALDTSGNPEKITVRSVLKEMSSKTWSSTKNLGKIAVLFSATECIIEGV